ncbi:MAG: hypothetical protein F6K36_20305 [Symploca sp. SIO3C6]|uniref:Uncharacterized protein n=1 Tax=Symploca sp. SIO1C4 TaxID=2607765 RepID=A0A6B3NBW9_9CYAN|nr:hypothetical protein [Symploca sp. SIO3C6]NER26668.1 hypothetical protein [Symploca sp. SIO1C4]NET08115.1 hypothetical protein [Symploca sp. SIO2B6]
MLRNITTLLKQQKFLRNNGNLKSISVTKLCNNGAFPRHQILGEENPQSGGKS